MPMRVLGRFPSSSSDKIYEVKLDESNDRLTCPDCTGWRMKRPGKTRGCKHTAKVVKDLTAQGWTAVERDEEVYLYPPGGGAAPVEVLEEAPEPVAAPSGPAPSLEALRAAAAAKRRA